MYEGKDEHNFYGTHAMKAVELRDLGFFDRLVDILAVAPLLGFEYNCVSDRNNQDNVEKGMFRSQLMKVDAQLELDYKTIMLLDRNYEPDETERFKKAFQTAPDQRSPEDLEHFEEYVRGGVDFLYDKLVGTGNTQYERLMELQEFVESFSERYY